MARPGFTNHRKFRRLVALLGQGRAKALGHMEFLWSAAYENGDPFLGDVLDVELAAEWDGAHGDLVDALRKCALIDETETGEYQIHDLYDHAPDYVRKRRVREQHRRETGKRMSGQCPVSDQSVSGQRPENGRTPAPAPAPAPAPNNICANAHSDDFEIWWSGYPKKVDKKRAISAYKARRKSGATAEQLLAARDRYLLTVAGKDLQYHRNPATLLNGDWEQWLTAPVPKTKVANDVEKLIAWAEEG